MSGPQPEQQRLRVFERPYSDQDDPRRVFPMPSVQRFVERLESPQAVRFAGERDGGLVYLGRNADELFLQVFRSGGGGAGSGGPSWTLEICGVACLMSSGGSDGGLFTICGIVPETTAAVLSDGVAVDIGSNAFAIKGRWPLRIHTPEGVLEAPLPTEQLFARLGERYPEILRRLQHPGQADGES
jgi:hypothetical protein